MNKDTKLTGFLSTCRADEARAFYRDILNLPLEYEDDYAIVFKTSGTTLRIQKVDEVAPLNYTSLGWSVLDIISEVEELSAKGVDFLRYPGMNQDQLGIWTAPSKARIAWFNDPDGHILSFTQM